MKRKTSVIVLAVSLFEALLFQPAAAQPGYGDWRRNPAMGGFADQQQSWRRRYQREYTYAPGFSDIKNI